MGLLGRFANELTLGLPINKANGESQENQEGVVTQLEDEFTLKIPDEELITLKNQWELAWEKYNNKIKGKQDQNEKYYMGKSFGVVDLNETDNPQSQNLIFEAVETSIPQYTAENPEPVVFADGTEEGYKIAEDVKNILLTKADTQHIKLKMKKAVRQWHLFYLGVFEIVWDEDLGDFNTLVVRPKKIGLDPEGVIDGAVFTGKWLFKLKTTTARELIELFPKKAAEIKEYVNGKLGTEIQYKEWWTNDYVFWTLKNEVLDKNKNPHWNPEKEEILTDVFGEETLAEVKGNNHFSKPMMPFVFISVFSLDTQPHDETSLVEQNRATQDRINKRIRQIDKNIDSMNGGWVISGDAFTKEQAADVANTLSKPSGMVWVPNGAVGASVARLTPTGLPADAYNQLETDKQALRSNFGITGLTPQGTQSEQTVRGKILVRGQDQNRATTISEALEQAYDQIYNWWIQMMYVYYDEAQTIPLLGQAQGTEMLSIQKDDFKIKLEASVKPGSMIPKDPLTQRNEAIDLWGAGAIDPLTLFKKLEFPDPEESAKQLFLWESNPAALFPDLGQPMQPGIPGTPEAPGAPEAQGQAPPLEPEAGGDVLPVTNPDLLSNIPIQ